MQAPAASRGPPHGGLITAMQNAPFRYRSQICGARERKMGELIRLQPAEHILHDRKVIEALYNSLGQPAADQLIMRALQELSQNMAALRRQIRRQELRDLATGLRKLRLMAENLGMVSLAQVALDAKLCLERGDGTGFAATWSRLMRLSARSLSPDPGSAGLSR